MSITDKIKQIPDGGIKLPVRYDYSEGDLVEDGETCPIATCTVYGEQFGGYIATCINEHARLVSELETAKRALEHYADERHWASAEENGVADWYDPTSSGGSVLANGYDIAQAALKSGDLVNSPE